MALALPLFGWRNLIDDAALTAGSEVSTLPVENLQTDDLGQVWRSTSATWILADLGAAVSIGGTSLPRTNFVPGDTVRVRVSTVDATGAAGDALDTTAVASAVDQSYDGLYAKFFTPVTGRYLRLDFSNAAPEAGRWTAFPTWRPPVSYRFDWKLLWRDHSRASFSEGMSRWVDRRPRQRGFRVTFRGLTHTDAFQELQEICRVIGTHKDFLFCRDPGSSNLSRETLWGYLEDAPPELGQAGDEVPDFFETKFEMWARI